MAADNTTVQEKEVYFPMRDVETLNESDEELGMEDLPSAETQGKCHDGNDGFTTRILPY